jgi:hypothetical protein
LTVVVDPINGRWLPRYVAEPLMPRSVYGDFPNKTASFRY